MTRKNNKPNLVFLPGMDGAGELFKPLLGFFKEYNCQIIKLPQSGPQDYPSLCDYVKDKLPTDDFVLIAESFSGPVAALLAQHKIDNLKGIVFIATFLSCPNKILTRIGKSLPLKPLMKFPGSRYFIKKLFLGNQTDIQLIEKFQSIVSKVPNKVLSNRIEVMQKLTYQNFKCQLPSIYLLPRSDRLVPKSKANEFKECFINLYVIEIDGPHFILQAQPKTSADIILEFLKSDINIS